MFRVFSDSMMNCLIQLNSTLYLHVFIHILDKWQSKENETKALHSKMKVRVISVLTYHLIPKYFPEFLVFFRIDFWGFNEWLMLRYRAFGERNSFSLVFRLPFVYIQRLFTFRGKIIESSIIEALTWGRWNPFWSHGDAIISVR